MQRYQNVVLDTNGNAIATVTVSVFLAGTLTPASIFSDNGITPKLNPFQTGIDGGITFYAANGRYDVTLTKVGYTFNTDLHDLQLFDDTADNPVTFAQGVHVVGTLTLDSPITVSAFNTSGNIITSAGRVEATAGQVKAGTTVLAGTGISSTTGDIVATAGKVQAATTVVAGTGITATTGDIAASAGKVTAGTSVEATTDLKSTGTLHSTGKATLGAGIDLTGILNVISASGATGYQNAIRIGSGYFWISSENLLLFKMTAPASDTDGTILALLPIYDTGFESYTDTTLSISGRVFTIAPTGASFNIYVNGHKFVKTGGASCSTTVPNVTQYNFIYFDNTGTLQNSATPWDLESNTLVMVACVYYDSTGSISTVTNERHNANINRKWHKWAHESFGMRWDSGLAVTPTISATTVAAGEVDDDDIHFILGSQTTVRLWYRRLDGSWTYVDQAASFLVSGGNLQYDNNGTLTALSAGQYCANWVYASNDKDVPIYVILGQAAYATQDDALAAIPQANFLSYQIFEMKLLAKVVAFMNGATATFSTSFDYRTTLTAAGGVPSTSRAAMIGFAPVGQITATNTQAAVNQAAGRWGAQANVADGGTITHGFTSAPTSVVISGSVLEQFYQVTAIGATTFTVAIRSRTGGAGSNATIYWHAWV